MKTIPFPLISAVMVASAILAIYAMLPFAHALRDIHREKSQASLMPSQIQERTLKAFVQVVGDSAGRQALFFSSLAIFGARLNTRLKTWYTKLFSLTLLGVAFSLSAYTFFAVELSIAALSSENQAELVTQIVASKIASLIAGLFSGGLLYECGKSWAGIE